MRIAILGTRGIPANYGGFETFAEELSARLVERGHEVTVYCREKFELPKYRGADLVYLPTIHNKYLDTLAHTFVSSIHLLRHPVDVALFCNGGNAIFTILPRLARIPVIINVDGIERKRRKWGAPARAWFHASEWLSTILPDQLVTDAESIRRYYLEHYGKDSVFIPYGADAARVDSKGTLDRLGLAPYGYFLYVSRFEPENRALEVRQAFEQVPSSPSEDKGMKLALIGDAPYAHDYIRRVRDTTDPRVVMPGAIYGLGYRELGSWCFAYIHATEVGGTHPALIEAMGRGCLVLYLETTENAEVCGDAGLPWRDEAELTARMRETLAMTEVERDQYRARAFDRVRRKYDWDAVTTQYETLFNRLRK